MTNPIDDARQWLLTERARNARLGWVDDTSQRHIAALLGEVERLQKLNEGLCERVAAQSELLSKKAEKPDPDLWDKIALAAWKAANPPADGPADKMDP